MKQNGHTSLPNEILDRLVYEKLSSLEMTIVLAVHRNTDGYKDKRGNYLTLYKIKKIAKDNNKRVRDAVLVLNDKKLIKIVREKGGYKVYPIQSVWDTKSSLQNVSHDRIQNVSPEQPLKPTLPSDCGSGKKNKKENDKENTINNYNNDFSKVATEELNKSKYLSGTMLMDYMDEIKNYGEDAFLNSLRDMNKNKYQFNNLKHAKNTLKKKIRTYRPNDDEPVNIKQEFPEPPEPDEPDLDPIWGSFEPYKRFFPETEDPNEVVDYFVDKILPVIEKEFPGYYYNPDNPKLKEVFKAYEKLKRKEKK